MAWPLSLTRWAQGHRPIHTTDDSRSGLLLHVCPSVTHARARNQTVRDTIYTYTTITQAVTQSPTPSRRDKVLYEFASGALAFEHTLDSGLAQRRLVPVGKRAGLAGRGVEDVGLYERALV